MTSSETDKFQWIREIIHTNVLSKIRGKNFGNILDTGTVHGSLLRKMQTIFNNSRFFAYSYTNPKNSNIIDNCIVLQDPKDVLEHNYDLILSVFDLHSMNLIEISEFLSFIQKISGEDTTIIFSDIMSNNLLSSILLKLATLFNPRLQSIMNEDNVVELLKEKGFAIKDKDKYRINSIWSAWIITCKKLN